LQDFVDAHRALIFRHARAHVKTYGEKIPAEDVAREIELELTQLGNAGLTSAAIDSPSAYVVSLVKHATGRAKRRHTLIEQLAAGDDLDALSKDLSELDADLHALPTPASPIANDARNTLDRMKDALSPQDALVFALLVEDEQSLEEVASTIGLSIADVASSRERILDVASQQDVPIDPEPRAERGAS
jgi:DNA-directed RNA polymerase specialized sigma24 family protein